MKKRTAIMTIASLLLLVQTACSQANDEARADEVTLAESWDFAGGFYPIETLTVNKNHGPAFYMVNFYETLINYDDGEFVPGLAESWDISGDGRVYTFHLRENVKFSDGTTFDAEAVKKNLEVIPGNLGVRNGTYGTVSTLLDQVIAVEPYTVEVHLTAPYYGALKDFTLLNPMAMISLNAFNADGTPADVLKSATFGTGPYMYEGDTDGSVYTFVRNPHYWGKAPEVERFHVKVIPDNDTKLLALRNGEVDAMVGTRHISYDAFQEMSSAGRFGTAVSEVASSTRLLGFNVTQAPFDDQQVRLAVSYGIDKESIIGSILAGIESRADSILDPAMPYCDVEITPYEYDFEKAKSILDRAGWTDEDGDGIREKDGMRLAGEIIYISGNAMMDDLMLVLSAQLKEIGMEIKVSGMEMMSYYTKLQQNDFTLAFNMTYGISWDPYTTVTNLNSDSETRDDLTAQAFALVDNGNEIIAALNTAVDDRVIQQSYDFILGEIHRHALFVPISYTKELGLFNKDKISGYTFNGQPASIDVAGIRLN